MSESLTKAEALERYGAVPLRFSSYYKYSFTFVGRAEDGVVISATFGGDASDIYRESINADTVRTLGAHEWIAGSIEREGETVCKWYDPAW